MRRKRTYYNSAAMVAIGAVVFGVALSAVRVRGENVRADQSFPGEVYNIVPSAGNSPVSSSVPDVPLQPGISLHDARATAELGSNDPHIMNAQARKIAAGAALAGLVTAMFNLFGATKLLQYVVNWGASVAKGAMKAAKAVGKAPVKAAKAAVKITTNTLAGSGKWVVFLGGLAIFAFTGVAHLDLQWQAGMALGAGLTMVATYGVGKTAKLTRRFTSSVRGKWGRPLADLVPAAL